MNLFEIQERLKDFSKDQLVKEMQMPSGSAPPFLVLSELQRRTRMEQAMKADGQGQPQSTVAEDAVNAAGVPQGGLQDMARALAPQTDMTENTGVAPVQQMQEGGQVRSGSAQLQSVFDQIFGGGATSPMVPQIMSYADRVAQLPVRTPPAAFTPSMPVMPSAPMPDMSGMDTAALAGLMQSAPDLATREAALEAMKASQGSTNAPTLPSYDSRPPKETGRAAGGLVRYQQGGLVDMATRVSTDPAVIAMANRAGLSVQEYIGRLEPEARRQLVRNAERRGSFDREADTRAYEESRGRTEGYEELPSQGELDQAYREEALGMRASRTPTAPAAGTALAGIPTTLGAVQRGAITGGLPRGPRGFSPLNFDTTDAAERAAAEEPSVPLNAMEEMYLRENRSGPPRRAVPPTPLEYGPPRRREAETPVNPMLAFQENFDYQGAPARTPSLPAVSPEGLQETIDAGMPRVDPMLAFQENFDYQGAPTFGPVPEPSTTGTPLQIPEGGVQELLPPPALVPDTTRATPPGGAGGPGGAGPTGVPANAQMSDNERLLNQDKWLALARVGLGLMASQAPTFGQALGEAGMAGMEALQSARADYLERKQAEEIMAMRRAAGAAGGRGAGASEAAGFGLSTDTARLLASLEGELDRVEAQLAGSGYIFGSDVPPALVPLVRQRERLLDDIGAIRDIGSGGAMSLLDQLRTQGGATGPQYDLTS